MSTRTVAIALGTALLAIGGCSNDNPPPPGPGPTAMPRSADGRPLGAGSGMNNEMSSGGVTAPPGVAK